MLSVPLQSRNFVELSRRVELEGRFYSNRTKSFGSVSCFLMTFMIRPTFLSVSSQQLAVIANVTAFELKLFRVRVVSGLVKK